MCRTRVCLSLSALLLGLLLVCTVEAAGPGLVAHYRLDEGSGTIAYDSSGNGYDGTVLGQPEWVPGPGDAGVALAFNPNTACTGIECPTFDPTDGTGQFSFTIWAFWDGEETYHHFFTKSDGWGQATMMFQLELWGGSTSAPHFNRVGISYDPDSIPFYEMPKNEWTHLAFVYDGAEMVVYLNGVDSMGPQAVTIGTEATDARTVIGVANDDARVWTGMLDDVQIYSRPLAAEEIAAIMEGSVGLSTAPQPENEATDVPADTTLGWTAGEFAAAHDVYLGTVFDDVNEADRADPRGVLVSQSQPETTYDPEGLLALGQTYYWRVDEVNAAPDYAIFKGEVWSFTTEPFAYPITNITASTNATSDAGAGPENTINGSGLNENDQHSIEAADMWLATAGGDESIWIHYEFDRVYKLHEMLVWNYNSQFELILGFGLKDVAVEYSSDGTDWTVLGDVQLARATATATYTANTTVNLGGVAAKYVRLTVQTAYGTMGQYGLSEVRFLHIPVQARQPQPADGQTDVDPDAALSWRAGREAASHEVYLSTDADAVTEGTALIDTVAESTVSPGALDFGNTYYWKVSEVNEAATPPVWSGDLWSFSTLEYVMVDDFESYDDEDNCIYDTWIDGWVNETGSMVGYLEAPFAERSIVHGGRQSMPLAYDNTAAPFYSETERTFDAPWNWAVNGADTLVVYLRGNPVAFLERADGSVVMGGAGGDIWDVADEFRLGYQRLSGDGSIVVRVDSLVNTAGWAKAGVMIRETLTPGSKHAMVVVTPGNGVALQYREGRDGASLSVNQTGFVAPYWVKLTRTGNTFVAERSADGTNWTSITADAAASSVDIVMVRDVYIGLALVSNNAGASPTVAEFSNISTTGTVTGAWQTEDIGGAQPSNDPEPLYVALEDTNGRVAVVNHPDPEAVLGIDWQAWQIPLDQFGTVNTASVRKMTIGIGDRDNPSAGGAGLVFIDDIQFGHPAAGE